MLIQILLEYSFVVKKPILFVDTPQKILNDDYNKLNTIAFEKSGGIAILYHGNPTVAIKKLKEFGF